MNMRRLQFFIVENGSVRNAELSWIKIIKGGIMEDQVIEQKKLKITIRLPDNIVKKLETFNNFTKSEIILRAIDYWLEKKEDPIFGKKSSVYVTVTQFKKAKSDDTRCLAAYSHDPYCRCGLERNHDGPHVFFCGVDTCPGYFFPHTPSNPHPCRPERRKNEKKCNIQDRQ